MDDLNLKTADELVRLHDGMCAEEARIDGPWKKSKRALIERIRALGNQEPDGQTAKAIEETGGRPMETVGALIEALVVTDITYDGIVSAVRARFPCARTTKRAVASIASAMRRQGLEVPSRK